MATKSNKTANQPEEKPEAKSVVAAPAVVIEVGVGKALKGEPKAGCHYCVYPAAAANPPADPAEVIEELKQAYPASAFTYFATR